MTYSIQYAHAIQITYALNEHLADFSSVMCFVI